jgi:ubiquitin carboxyl-terminal hydrolase 5/13
VIARQDASQEAAVLAWEASNELVPSKYVLILRAGRSATQPSSQRLPTYLAARCRYYANLVQLDNGITISPDPKTWRCAESGLQENLWLNLSTGYIGSGRRNWDGSGGTGAAVKHYEDTGRLFPLVVKLGTITPDGKADVYSYAPEEDCLVLDPLLSQHLAHWGIRVGDLLKTDKTMAEMEVSLNESHDWTRIAQDGAWWGL